MKDEFLLIVSCNTGKELITFEYVLIVILVSLLFITFFSAYRGLMSDTKGYSILILQLFSFLTKWNHEPY